MQYRALGRTGLRVSEVGFGGAVLGIAGYLEPWDPRGAVEFRSAEVALNRALDLGLNYVDTAPAYGDGTSEETIGRAIGHRRAEFVLATKVSARDPAGLAASVEASLRRLRTDLVDVLQFHGGRYPEDDQAAILERGGLQALERLRQQGKARFLGFTAEGPSPGVSRLIASGAFDVLQVRYNFLYQDSCDFVNEEGVMREAEARGLGVVTMRTLTSGLFQKTVQQALPGLRDADIEGFLLNYVLSNPLIDVALVGMRRAEEAERNNAVSDDAARRLDLAALHDRFPGRAGS